MRDNDTLSTGLNPLAIGASDQTARREISLWLSTLELGSAKNSLRMNSSPLNTEQI